MDNRISGLLDLTEALKDQPPATTYPDMPLEVLLSYPTLAEAEQAAREYGATVEHWTKKHYLAYRGFAHQPGNFHPGARLVVSWTKRGGL